MNGREVVALALLLAGVVVGLCAALGLVPTRSAFDKLHLLAPASTVGLALIVAAIVVREGLSSTGAKTILAGALLFLMGPIVTHMTARARWHGGRRGGAAQVKERELEE
jgi:multicomponent Na+:H+ antiporter subunit G